MDKLPSEILSDIFLRNVSCSHESDPSPHSTPNPHSIQAPLSVSHVCRFWRDVSLSCGELWSYLQISFGSKVLRDENRRKQVLKLFDTWLSRTNGSPISYMVEILPTNNEVTGTEQDVEHIITTLVSQQHRWKDVSFTWDSVRVSSGFPDLILTNMPMLTSLSLMFSFESDTPHRATISIAQSLRLKCLRLYGTFDLDPGNVPIRTLTEPSVFNFESPSQNDPRVCLNFLRVTPYLTEFKIAFQTFPSELHFDNDQPILLPHLRVFEAEGPYSTLVTDNLTLPSLEILVSDDSRCEPGSEIHRNFFRRSLPPLIQLELIYEDVNVFIPSLRLLPKLEKLVIVHSTLSDTFFHELTVPHDVDRNDPTTDSRILCPSLVEIYISDLDVEGDIRVCIGALFSMIKSRVQALGTLSTVELQPDRSFGLSALRGSTSSAEEVLTALQGGDVIIRGDV